MREDEMSSESSQDHSMKELWQGQKLEGARMSVEQIRASSGKFQRRVTRRNMREYIASIAAVVFFGFSFTRMEDLLMRIGLGLVVVGTFYVLWQLLTRGSPGPPPEDAGLTSWVDFHRRELERQRQLLSSIWRWYLGPFIPGIAVIIVAAERGSSGRTENPGLVAAMYAAFCAVAFVAIAKLNSRAARKLQRQIDALDELSREG
jgi:hypothetical protein